MSKIAGAVHLATCYLTALPRILYRSTLSMLIDPRGSQKFLHEVLEARDFSENCPVLGSVTLAEFFQSHQIGTERAGNDVALIGRLHETGSSETRQLSELAALARLMCVLNPRRIFEFGTFVGRMTRLLAVNAPQAEIVTLDLPRDLVKHDVGCEFRGTPEAARITQLSGDSRTFDFSRWKGVMDFVWVDACHDYEFVVADTARALELAAPGAVVAWHDYRLSVGSAGVTRALRELKRNHIGLRHIRGTSIAILRIPE